MQHSTIERRYQREPRGSMHAGAVAEQFALSQPKRNRHQSRVTTYDSSIKRSPNQLTAVTFLNRPGAREMTEELKLLAWAVVLGLVHAVATGQFTTAQHGIKYGLGERDEQKPLTGIGARVQRAFANYMQTFPFFVAAILMAHLVGRHSWLTLTGAHLYLWARVAYVPLYAFGVTGVRTLAFIVSVVGIVMLLLALT